MFIPVVSAIKKMDGPFVCKSSPSIAVHSDVCVVRLSAGGSREERHARRAMRRMGEREFRMRRLWREWFYVTADLHMR